MICSVEECERPVRARGWCSMHYHRWQRHGDPAVALRFQGSAETRFWHYTNQRGPVVRRDLGRCWDWTGPCRSDEYPYGHLSVGDHTEKAHRFAYQLLVGPIPPGMDLDHLCRRQLCVNPAHLEPVTFGENMRRRLEAIGHHNSDKTACPYGHSYTAANTRYLGSGSRVCKTCAAEYKRAWRTERRESGQPVT